MKKSKIQEMQLIRRKGNRLRKGRDDSGIVYDDKMFVFYIVEEKIYGRNLVGSDLVKIVCY